MPGHTCTVCGNNRSQDPSVSFHRFPSNPDRRARWLSVFGMEESELRSQTRVCSRHFPDGDAKTEPMATLGKRFTSPIKGKLPRAKRAKSRDVSKEFAEMRRSVVSRPVETSSLPTPMDLPGDDVGMFNTTLTSSSPAPTSALIGQSSELLVSKALLARIDALEAESSRLKSTINSQPLYFRIEQIQNDDHLIRFYTGFVSYIIFIAFFEFLGPAVNTLNYWGSGKHARQRHYSHKLNPKNQFFLMLVKLKLNLKVQDLAFRFGISTSSVSCYLTTWICFLYHHLKELDWSPSIEQVMGTLPHSFRKNFPSTYAIIDGSEIFIQTPSDLYMQSSTWSQYKHHNTAKFLVACTPNGAISYISPVHVCWIHLGH